MVWPLEIPRFSTDMNVLSGRCLASALLRESLHSVVSLARSPRYMLRVLRHRNHFGSLDSRAVVGRYPLLWSPLGIQLGAETR